MRGLEGLTVDELLVLIAALNYTRNHAFPSWERRDEKMLEKLQTELDSR